MSMSLRFQIFTADLDGVVAFYTEALRFSLIRDEREASLGYVALVTRLGGDRRRLQG